ncbi:MAG: hypothetical protein JWP76_1286 [Dactylosporangium sp.]|nr:hypothetical protein [Dactylosporangium sp.]
MDGSRLGSAREEAERLMAAGLAAASMALHGVEANRQLRGLAEQVFGADRMHDLAAGLAGFVSGSGSGATSGPAGDGPSAGSSTAGSGFSTAGSSAAGSGASSAGLSTGSADCCVCPVCRLIAALRDPSPEFAERLATAAGDLAVGISGLMRALSGAMPGPGHDTGDDPWRAATTATPAPPEPAAAAPGKPAAAASEVPTPASKPVAKKATAKKTTAKKAVRKVVHTDPTDSAP